MKFMAKTMACAALTAVVTGCGGSDSSGSGNSDPVVTIPAALAENLSMVDTHPDPLKVSGLLEFDNPESSDLITYFAVYLLNEHGYKTGSAIGVVAYAPAGSYRVEIADISIETGQQLGVFAGNEKGESAMPAAMVISDRSRPGAESTAEKGAFYDVEFAAGSMAGMLMFKEADVSRNVGEYHVYIASGEGEKPENPWVIVDSGMGDYQVELTQSTDLIPGTEFWIYAANEMGEQLEPLRVAVEDLVGSTAITFDKVHFEQADGWTNFHPSGGVELPFLFSLFGNSYSSLSVCPESGVFYFGAGIDCDSDEIWEFQEGYTDSLPIERSYLTTTGFNMEGAFLGHRYDYKIIGEAPNREFVINVQDTVLTLEDARTQEDKSFGFYQIRLKENQQIEMHAEWISAKAAGHKPKQRLVSQDGAQTLSFSGDERGDRMTFEYTLESDAVRFSTNPQEPAPGAVLQAFEYLGSGKARWQGAEDESNVAGYQVSFLNGEKQLIGHWRSFLPVGESERAMSLADIPAETEYFQIAARNAGGVSEAVYEYSFQPEVPQHAIEGVQYLDWDTFERVKGSLVWQVPADESNISGYRIFESRDGVQRAGAAIAQVPTGTEEIRYELTDNTISHLILVAYNESGESEQQFAAEVINRRVGAVRNAEFIDTDPDANEYGGVIRWQAPLEGEDDMDRYRVLITGLDAFEVPVDGPLEVVLPENTTISSGAIYIYGYLGNRNGTGVTINVVDLVE